MPIFQGRDGEIMPSKRNPMGSISRDSNYVDMPKKTQLCSKCKVIMKALLKGENTTRSQFKACEDCKSKMKELFRQSSRSK